MKSCEKRNYEPIRLKIVLYPSEDVLTLSFDAIMTDENFADADYSWLD